MTLYSPYTEKRTFHVHNVYEYILVFLETFIASKHTIITIKFCYILDKQLKVLILLYN
jgi:hypothetical protein